jgi:hypothetical protein
MIEVKAQGTGGLSEFKANLGESLAWGGFKCIAVDNREVGSTTRDAAAFADSKLPPPIPDPRAPPLFTSRFSLSSSTSPRASRAIHYLPSLLHT